jgi:hypothetical protein
MRFRKAMVLANFLTVCLVLAFQSAKATTITGTILIDDDTDTVTVTDPTGRVGPSGSTVPTCGIANVELCALTLSAPPTILNARGTGSLSNICVTKSAVNRRQAQQEVVCGA